MRNNKVVDTSKSEKGKGRDTKSARIAAEARECYLDAMTVEQDNMEMAVDDLRMLAGESHWSQEVLDARKNRPCLTVNMLPAFADQITNSGRMNKVGIKVIPTGGGATPELALLMGGLIKGIERQSEASSLAYQTALDSAVQSGFGYIRVNTKYADNTSFDDQEIAVEPIYDPTTVLISPLCRHPWGIGAPNALITEEISRDEYKARYPRKSEPSQFEGDSVTTEFQNWIREDMVRVGEFWKLEPHKHTIVLLSDMRIMTLDDWESSAEQVNRTRMENNQPEITISRQREVDSHKVVQYFVDGEKIIEGPFEWAGTQIPIIRVPGRTIVIGAEVKRRSAIRDAKDSQRIYNYFRSISAETVALAPKAPYLVDMRTIADYVDIWDRANSDNLPYLPYRPVQGSEAPKRQQMTQTALGEIAESNISESEMKRVIGLHEASLGASSNERTGKAIALRQSRGDTAHFNYHDNLRIAVGFVGQILVDIIPKIYDTERQLMVVTPKDEDQVITVNQMVMDGSEDVIVNDLSIGKYKVHATAGPSTATQRIEAAESLQDFARVAPNMATYFLDLLAEALDWPQAPKIAERIKKIINMQIPGLTEDGPPQQQPPDLDQLIKKARLQGIVSSNVERELDINIKKAGVDNANAEVAAQAARSAIQTVFQKLGMGGGDGMGAGAGGQGQGPMGPIGPGMRGGGM